MEPQAASAERNSTSPTLSNYNCPETSNWIVHSFFVHPFWGYAKGIVIKIGGWIKNGTDLAIITLVQIGMSVHGVVVSVYGNGLWMIFMNFGLTGLFFCLILWLFRNSFKNFSKLQKFELCAGILLLSLVFSVSVCFLFVDLRRRRYIEDLLSNARRSYNLRNRLTLIKVSLDMFLTFLTTIFTQDAEKETQVAATIFFTVLSAFTGCVVGLVSESGFIDLLSILAATTGPLISYLVSIHKYMWATFCLILGITLLWYSLLKTEQPSGYLPAMQSEIQ